MSANRPRRSNQTAPHPPSAPRPRSRIVCACHPARWPLAFLAAVLLAPLAASAAEDPGLAYSPDLNPIEMMWSKVKALLRKAQARSLADLLRAIACALSAVSAQDALHWFAAYGYSFI